MCEGVLALQLRDGRQVGEDVGVRMAEWWAGRSSSSGTCRSQVRIVVLGEDTVLGDAAGNSELFVTDETHVGCARLTPTPPCILFLLAGWHCPWCVCSAPSSRM